MIFQEVFHAKIGKYNEINVIWMGFKLMEISSWVVICLDLLVPFLELKKDMWTAGVALVQQHHIKTTASMVHHISRTNWQDGSCPRKPIVMWLAGLPGLPAKSQ